VGKDQKLGWSLGPEKVEKQEKKALKNGGEPKNPNQPSNTEEFNGFIYFPRRVTCFIRKKFYPGSMVKKTLNSKKKTTNARRGGEI